MAGQYFPAMTFCSGCPPMNRPAWARTNATERAADTGVEAATHSAVLAS